MSIYPSRPVGDHIFILCLCIFKKIFLFKLTILNLCFCFFGYSLVFRFLVFFFYSFLSLLGRFSFPDFLVTFNYNQDLLNSSAFSFFSLNDHPGCNIIKFPCFTLSFRMLFEDIFLHLPYSTLLFLITILSQDDNF